MSEKADIKPRAEFEGLTAYLIYDCPSCGANRHPMRGLTPGSSVTCRCGDTIVNISGQGGSEVQAGLDKVQSAFDTLGEKLKKLSQ
jgi:hypothetical protein